MKLKNAENKADTQRVKALRNKQNIILYIISKKTNIKKLFFAQTRLVYRGPKNEVPPPTKKENEPGMSVPAEHLDPQVAAEKAVGRETSNALHAIESSLASMESAANPTIDDFSKIKSPGDLGRLIENGQNTNWKLVEAQLGCPEGLFDVLKLTSAKTVYDVLNLPASIISDLTKVGEGTAKATNENASFLDAVSGLGSDALRVITIVLPALKSMGILGNAGAKIAGKTTEAGVKLTAEQITKQLSIIEEQRWSLNMARNMLAEMESEGVIAAGSPRAVAVAKDLAAREALIQKEISELVKASM